MGIRSHRSSTGWHRGVLNELLNTIPNKDLVNLVAADPFTIGTTDTPPEPNYSAGAVTIFNDGGGGDNAGVIDIPGNTLMTQPSIAVEPLPVSTNASTLSDLRTSLFGEYAPGAPVWMVRGEFGDSLAPTTDEWGAAINYGALAAGGGEAGLGVYNASPYYQATPISAADAAKIQAMISSNPLGLSGDSRALWDILAKGELARLSAGDEKTKQYDVANMGLPGTFDDVMSNADLWNSPWMQNYAASRIAAGNKENILADLLQGVAWVGGGALGINSLLGNGIGSFLNELGGGVADTGYIDALGGMTDASGTALSGWTDAAGSALVNPVVDAGVVTGTDLSSVVNNAADFGGFDGVTAADLAGTSGNETLASVLTDSTAGLSDAAVEDYLNSFGSDLATGTNSVVDTATNTAANVATGGGTDVGIWDDTLFDGISDIVNNAGIDTSTLDFTGVDNYLQSFNGIENLYGSGGITDLGTTLGNTFGDVQLGTDIATSFGDSAGWVNNLLSNLTGDDLTKATNALKTMSGVTSATGGVTRSIGDWFKQMFGGGGSSNNNLLSTILSGLTGIYASQNKAQDLTEAAKYLTENSNPYRSYIKDGTVGGDGSVTAFMKGFQTPANNMATAAGNYNTMLNTSYTDPLSIWNSPEMQGLNNIFKQQIDRRDSAAGRNSQYGARAVEMQNNFLSNALPKYRTGLNDALNTTSTAASNFGKVATPPGSGTPSENVGGLLTGAANSNNGYAGAVGSMLDQLFNKP